MLTKAFPVVVGAVIHYNTGQDLALILDVKKGIVTHSSTPSYYGVVVGYCLSMFCGV